MSLIARILAPLKAVWQRYCTHEWAPSRSQAGWVCVRCGLREKSGASTGDAPR